MRKRLLSETRPKDPKTPGAIPLGVILPIREACRLLGWGDRGLAHAKSKGLQVLKFSKWSYIATDDLLAFLRSSAVAPKPNGSRAKEED